MYGVFYMLLNKENEVVKQIEFMLAEHREDSLARSLDVLVASVRMGMGPEGAEAINDSINAYYKIEEKRRKALEIEKNVLKNIAFQDSLTGIPNRRYLKLYLDAVLKEAEAKKADVSLIAIDLDHFKWVNDIYGHDVGDIVLQKMKGILPASLRDYDHVFMDKKLKTFKLDKEAELKPQLIREGGEEFYVVLPNTVYAEAVIVAERIRSRIKEEFDGFFDKYKPIPTRENRKGMPELLKALTASIGISTTNKYFKVSSNRKEYVGYDADNLKKAADLGAYLVKKEGRDNVKSICLDS